MVFQRNQIPFGASDWRCATNLTEWRYEDGCQPKVWLVVDDYNDADVTYKRPGRPKIAMQVEMQSAGVHKHDVANTVGANSQGKRTWANRVYTAKGRGDTSRRLEGPLVENAMGPEATW